ncbi:MAG: hypothetical protein ACE5H9_01755 [Anaerolineae bacterium]
MKLTPRQQAFLDKLFDLYREFQGPVHYSLVAERLGVNKFSAYDMLKLLEEKGVAASEYVLGHDQTGPGRSTIQFYPTNQAIHFLSQLRDEVRQNKEWRLIKDRITRRLQEAREGNPSQALKEALSRISDAKTPLSYCAETISALLINLERVQTGVSEIKLIPMLSKLNLSGEARLGALAGLSLGSALTQELDDPILTATLASHIQNFQTQLSNLSEDGIRILSAFLEDAVVILEG